MFDHPRRHARLLLCVVFPYLASACSSSSTEAQGGGGAEGGGCATQNGADGGACPVGNAPECALHMPVQGGLSGSLDGGGVGSGCGVADGGVVLFTPRTQVLIRFACPLEVGAAGVAAVDSIEILPVSDGGMLPGWKTPSGACSVTIASSACYARQNTPSKAYVLSGTGSCTAAAAPESGQQAAPVTIGDFSFTSLFAPGF